MARNGTIPLVAGYLRKKRVRFPMSPTRLGPAESNFLLFRANSATFNAPTTATMLGRDPGMRRNVLTGPLLAPQPKVREITLGRQRAACLEKMSILYIKTYQYIVYTWIYAITMYKGRFTHGLLYQQSRGPLLPHEAGRGLRDSK